MLSGIVNVIATAGFADYLTNKIKSTFEKEAHKRFLSKNPIPIDQSKLPVSERVYDLINGKYDGKMDSFRHTLTAAVMQILYGDGAALLLKINEWNFWRATNGPMAFRMDMWNNEIGIRIGQKQDVSELTLEELETEYGLPPVNSLWDDTEWEKYCDQLVEGIFADKEKIKAIADLVEPEVDAAINSGLVVQSVFDPRLRMLDSADKDKNAASLNTVNKVEADVKQILDAVNGGVESGNNKDNQKDLTEIFNRVIRYQYNHRDKETFSDSLWELLDNDTPQRGTEKTFAKDAAHELLQLVNWAREPEQGLVGNACDPANDPTPKYEDGSFTDPLDHEMTKYSLLAATDQNGSFISRFQEGAAAKLFAREGKYYLVFNEPFSNDFNAKLMARDIGLMSYVNEAYVIYRKMLSEYGIIANNVTLLGYGAGGAIVSALSAALYCGGFAADKSENGKIVYGEYDPGLATYGWSMDYELKNDVGIINNNKVEIIDNYPSEIANAVTFNAPSMGWLFGEGIISVRDVMKESDINPYRVPLYSFVAHESKYLEKIKGAPVTNYGMRDDEIYVKDRSQFGIGESKYLDEDSGKIPAYKEEYGVLPSNWHAWDTLELAFHEPEEEEEKDEVEEDDDAGSGGGGGGGDGGGRGPGGPPVPNPPQDPLIIDLNRDGKVSTTSGKRYFDMDANGIAERVSWAASGDGFLVLDRDGDGIISSGRELFGDNTMMSNGKIAVSGFQALADLDSNKDGMIDARDELFSQLRVWADKNGDGTMADGEYYTLEELGIESIALQYAEENTVDENGNRIVRTGKVTWKDGDTGPISEFLLSRDTRQGQYPRLEVGEEIAALPELSGRGYLYSLQQAMVRDGSGKLKELVEQFAAEVDSIARKALLERIFIQWSEVSDIVASPCAKYGKDWLVFLDKYHGGINVGNPSAAGWEILKGNYDAVSLYLYGKLLGETHFADELAKIDYDVDVEGNIYLVIRRALESIAKEYANEPEQTKRSIAEFFLVLKDTRAFEYLRESEIEANEKMLSTYGAELVNVCRASYMAMQYPIGEFTLPVTGENPALSQVLEGDIYNNVILGGDVGDILRGGRGSDILIGGRGDDTLVGGADSDVYIWNLGDGSDTILNSTSGDEIDILRIGEGVHPDNVTIERSGNTIRLVVAESGEIITLATDHSLRWGDAMNPILQLARVEFADGTTWSREYMLGRLVTFTGTEANETIEASVGNDVLNGGGGDDILRGGRGSDIYVWKPGDGNDTIRDERIGVDINVLKLEGMAPEDVELVRDGDNLVLAMEASGERVTLEKWYGQAVQNRYRLHRIEFEDGTVWTSEDIELFDIRSEDLVGTDGDDTLDGVGGDEFLIGKKGNDTLRGGAGSDTYVWNLGDGNDTIFDYVRTGETNVLRFGEGIDVSMLEFRRDGEDLLIIVKDTGETITLSMWDNVENHKLAWIEFADESRMTSEEIDVRLGDYVRGTEGKDVLQGSWRHRVLDGGKGDDTLYGGQGGCTYLWNIGDGNDTIQNARLIYNRNLKVGSSYLQFGEGVTPEDISLRSANNDLVVTHRESGETITIEGWYVDPHKRLEAFKFEDGTTWIQEKIEQLRDKDIYGTDGNDTVVGFESADVLIGKKGDDLLEGRNGSDTYVWNRGDGDDTITDVADGNTLKFGTGISSSDIVVTRQGDNLCIAIAAAEGDDGGTITLSYWFQSSYRRSLSRVVFGNGAVWSTDDLEASLDKTLRGTDGDDILDGYTWGDTFIGGKGDDIIRGWQGDDTYIWNLGDGNDRLEDGYSKNLLKFGENVSPEMVHLRQVGRDLLVTMLASGETVTLTGWFGNKAFEMEFADGVVWNKATIESNVDRWLIGTDSAEQINGTSEGDFIQGQKGDDLLSGGGGNDTYVWNLGDGNDRIDDYYGMNLLQFGEGVNPGDLRVTRNGNDLILAVGEGGESVTVTGWFRYKLCTVKFSDGTNWDVVDIGMRVDKEYGGTDGNDTISGYEMDETFAGGKGNDTLTGNGGEDLYIWNPGDGNDVINNYNGGSWNSKSKGTLRFGEGVDPGNITTRSIGADLVFVIGETGETVTVQGWRSGTAFMVGRIEFADGTVWSADEIEIDVLRGTEGNDSLSGLSRSETFIGGKGNDALFGGTGSDTYIWNLGDGNDTISDYAAGSDVNVLRFGEGVDPASITFNNNGSDLILMIGETGETITIKNCRNDSRYLPYRIEFADGTIWEAADLDLGNMVGTDGDDTLLGTGRNEKLTGGKGSDRLEGRAGDDTYLWNPGDGNDTIFDNVGVNVLEFGAGVAPEDLQFIRYGDNVVIEISETGERITVQGWFIGRQYQFYQMKFADGTLWSRDDIAQKMAGIFGTEGVDYLTGTDGDDRFFGFAGDDMLEGGAGNDVYEWDSHDGNDTIRDTEGTTRVKFGKDVSADDIRVGRDNTSTILFSLKTGEKIRLEGSLFPHEVLFEDGTIWTRAMMQKMNLTIFGTDGDDTIFNNTPPSGETVYAGGKGDDTIYGAQNNDTFVWNLGDGNDTISVYNYAANNNIDVLRFGEGVLPSEVLVARSGEEGENLCFIIEKTGERITIGGWPGYASCRLSEVRFADGTVWTQAEIDAMQYTYKGTDNDDVLSGFEDDDLVIGGKGHDRLYGNEGDDIVRGEEGNDKLFGNAGDDTLTGGKGIDLLEGGEGRDIYEWNIGDGDDIIKDSDNNGVLRFGQGIDPESVRASLQNGDVVFKVDASGETIHLKSYLTEIAFADGTVWSWGDVLAQIGPSLIRGTDGDDTLGGTIIDDTIAGGKGDDALLGGDGRDTYIWNLGDGSDTIEDVSGTSTLAFGENIVPGSVTTAFEGSSLVLAPSSGERITVKGWLDDVTNRLTEIRFEDGTIWTPDDIREMTPPAVIEGTNLADDLLKGTDMHDIITGKAGDDWMSGGEGDDTYVWNLGDGNDRISDVQGKSVLRFGAGIRAENLRVVRGYRENHDLIVMIGGRAMWPNIAADDSIWLIVGETGERIALEKWYGLLENRSFEVAFEDGSVLTVDDLEERLEPLYADSYSVAGDPERDDVIKTGDEGNGMVNGLGGNDVIIGGNGADYLSGGDGDDVVIGGDGDDQLHGDDSSRYSNATGNDTLIGGKGDDQLSGGPGDDTYVWNLGDGNDSIYTYTSQFYEVGRDRLQFGEGILASDVSFGYNGGSLQIFVKEGDPANEAIITVYEWFDVQEGSTRPLEEVCFADGTILTVEQIEGMVDRSIVKGTSGDDYLDGSNNGETLTGGPGNDQLYGRGGNDTLSGESGNDSLSGGDGDDTLIGGTGDDSMRGESGNDTYIWNLGDGNDTISDWSGNNILQFGEGILPGDIKACRDRDNLVLTAEDRGGETVTFYDWFSSWHDPFGEIHFGDGTVWAYADIQELVLTQGGASAGDDLISGTSGDDDLDGFGGNDIIRGNEGNDTIRGGRGNDYLYGDGDNDTYLWNRGDGNDLIEDAQGENVLRIGGGVDPESIRIENNDTDLILVIGNERITVKKWLASPVNQLKEIRIGDSAIWTKEHVNTILSEVIGTENNDILEGRGNNRDDKITGLGGDDLLKGGGGNDTYIWNLGDGNDTIEDFVGLNTLQFGEGVSKESVRVERDRDHLYFVVGDERIQVAGWFSGGASSQLNSVRFSNGTTWSRGEINEMLVRIVGTEGADSLHGYGNTSDTLEGLGGDDILYGAGGADIILWSVGDGNDTILAASGSDTLRFTNWEITKDTVHFERDEEHLYIAIGNERIKVEGWYEKKTQLGLVSFANGTSFTAEEINRIVDYVEGTTGNDVLQGYNNSHEVFEGHAGDDKLYGGGSNDTYLWNIGDGSDTIFDFSGNDILKFGPDVQKGTVRVIRDADNLCAIIGNERITLENWFGVGQQSTVRKFLFADGSSWDGNALYEMACRIKGTNSKDTLNGFETNDTLTGMKGNDTLQGGGGNDTYIWNLGDGDDRIIDSQGNNILSFGDDIYNSFVRVRRDGDHLCFDIEGERVTVENWFSDPTRSQLQAVRFSDGVVWSRSDIQLQLGITEEMDRKHIVRGGSGDDILRGDSSSERIYGGDGNDTIRGAKGDDRLYGEGGNDTYEWSIGDGDDRILDSQGRNALAFGIGILPDDVEITRDDCHLYVTCKESGERITIESWYAGASNKLSEIRFQDGTIWGANYIDSLFVPMEGTENNDSILGYDSDDVILGLAGDDVISGRGGDDVLIGGSGKDKLYGGAGNDVYIWEPGDGSDRIGDNEGINTLRFGEGVSTVGIRITRAANNLYFHIGDKETVCVEDWFRNETSHLSVVEFADGTQWAAQDVEERITGIGGDTPTEGDDTLVGTVLDEVMDGLAGNDFIYGGDGDDLLVGNKGRDILRGEGGDDTYFWNKGDGNDIVIDSQGSNRLEFGPGIDWTMVKVEPYGMDLMLRIGEEYIRIADWFGDEANQFAEIAFVDGTVWSRDELNANCNVVNGTEAADTLHGVEKSDVIVGREGNDRIYGKAGADSLVGGKGADYLDGGAGDDSYIWNPGDGNDTIVDYSGRNILQIGEGVDPSEVEIQRVGNDLAFIFSQTGERLTVANWYVGSNHQLAEVRFGDGTVWTSSRIDKMPSIFRGSENNDRIYASNSPDEIYGNEGDDVIYGNGGHDVINGGVGDDRILGGAGDDTYVWRPGDGNDTINDNSGVNVLKLGGGIVPSDIVLERSGPQNGNIVFAVKKTGERITVENWFTDNRYQIARIEFADGTIWTRLDVMDMSPRAQGTDESDILYGTLINDTLMGLEGDDRLYGYAGRDTLVGGTGNDRLEGGEGNDVYIWNPGDGSDDILDASGTNTLQFGEGLSPSNVEITREDWVGGRLEGNLVLVVKTTGERIRIWNWYRDEKNQFTEIRFADGTIWTQENVGAMYPLFTGTAEADTLSGSGGKDRIEGYAGDDKLYGNAGDDILVGGTGSDTIDGGAGNDTYVWNFGDGNDILRDNMGKNVLAIGDGVDPSGIVVSLAGPEEMDLRITIGETGEYITIQNWRSSRNAQFNEIRFGDGTVWTLDELKERFPLIDDRGADDVLYGTEDADTLKGFGGKDKLYGLGGDDTLMGGDDDDELRGGEGNDRLIGGEGIDIMDGAEGDDTYVWNPGDGSEAIYDDDGSNVFEIGEGVDPTKISLSRNTKDLYLLIAETGEQITIQDWYHNSLNQFVEIRFANGTIWRANDVNMMNPVLTAPEEGGTVTGFNTNDILLGGSGNDMLYGNAGNDVLEGRRGDDYLDGGVGDDTYIWNLEDGNDTISDAHNRNVLTIGSGVDPEKVTIGRSGNGRDLYLQVNETGECLTIKNWYLDTANQLAEIRFADGTVWTADDVNAMNPIQIAPEEGGSIAGFGTDDIIIGGSGNDRLYGNAGNDTLIGKGGEDYLDGGYGDDTYVWNPGDGNDTIYDCYGRNVLQIGEGVDPEKVTIGRSGKDLYLEIEETGERITLKDWYYNVNNQLAEIRFADGSIWSTTDITGKTPVLPVSEEGGTVLGFETDDTLIGSKGDDKIYGYGGNDVLDGKRGDDTLEGGVGDDAYIWNLGDGNDTIVDSQDANILRFGGAVLVSDVTVSLTGDNNKDLLITIGTSGEKIVVQDWGVSRNAQLAEILFEDGTIWRREDINAMLPTLNDGDADDIVEGTAGSDILHGYGGNDKFYGRDGDDSLFGDGGDDELYGGVGNDILVGGTGSDRLEGGAGDDTYIWNPGDGNDVVVDNEGNNVLQFGDGVQADDVRITRDENSLWFQIGTTGESIRIDGWYENAGNQLFEVRFADGTVWTKGDINAMNPVVTGEGEDTTLTGFDTDDILSGGSGNETLSGGAGDDTLIGDAGDDRLEGGTGNDTYIWNLGDGNDTIADSEGEDVLQFGEGVNSETVEVSREGEDLYVQIGDGGERIRVEGWFNEEENQLSEIRFDDGTIWTRENVNAMFEEPPVDPIDQATDGDDVLTGTSGDDTLDGLAGNDTIYGGEGDDTIVGGLGNDTLHGEAGNDTYTWNLGDGSDVIVDNQGNNKLQLGDGITQSMVNVGFDGRDLILTIGSNGEKIRIAGWLDDATNRLAAIEFADGSAWDTNAINAKIALISGTDGDDTVNGTAGNDILSGGTGNDRLYGNNGNDTLIGGTGDDNLVGGAGNDTYIWNPGDGNDTITDRRYQNVGTAISILKIGEGVDPANVSITRDERSLYLLIGETGEKIKITDWYHDHWHQLTEVQFADGTVWTTAQVNAMTPILAGTDADDMINGFSTNDIIDGGAGNDTLNGGEGNDTLTGGTGDDNLAGGAGNDTYIWNPGDGNDTITDTRYQNVGTAISILKIGEGVDPANVSITRDDRNLYFLVGETGEKIKITDWYHDHWHQLTEVQFADGTVWTTAQINAMTPILSGTDGNDTISGGNSNDVLMGGKGDDYLAGGWGNDTYIWNLGDGNDTISDNRIYTPVNIHNTILKIGTGVDPATVTISRDETNLYFNIGETGEKIKIANWYTNTYSGPYQLTEVRFADGTVWTNAQINAMPALIEGSTDGDDTISGYDSHDILSGGAGNDVLLGGYGNDTLIGGAGADYLDGGWGNDTYIWNPGDGDDTIRDNRRYTPVNIQTTILKIGEGVDPANVTVSRDATNLYLNVGETGERIKIVDWHTNTAGGYQLTEVQFADGTIWTNAQINAMRHIIEGSTDGDDTISGFYTNDTLMGGAGNDVLLGDWGDDTLIGGAGDDYLDGGWGHDTYVWKPGDGNDRIRDDRYYTPVNKQISILEIGEGINPALISLSRDQNDLVFHMGNDETVTVKEWYARANFQLNEVRFADGTIWTNSDMSQIAAGTKEPFSTAPVVEGQPEEGEMGPLSAPVSGNGENAPLFSLLGDPSEGVQTSYRYGEEMDDLSSLAATPTDWASDPSLASIMNEPELLTVGDFATLQLDVDIAVASLQFGAETPEQVCDLVGSAASASGSYTVSTSAEGNVGSCFSEEQRKSA